MKPQIAGPVKPKTAPKVQATPPPVVAGTLADIKQANVRKQLDDWLSRYRGMTEEISALEAAKNSMMSKKLGPLLDSLGYGKLESDTAMALKVRTVRKTIKQERLLERGVSFDDIEYATDVSESESWQIRGRNVSERD